MPRPFHETLAAHGRELRRGRPSTLQVNVGLLCNQTCKHCHLEAGPKRTELMSRATMEQVIGFAAAHRFHCIDITGGAPELNPDLGFLLERLAPLADRLMLRCNLTALDELAAGTRQELLGLCQRLRVALVASLPATNEAQTDAMRGDGVLGRSLATLRSLNALGYGKKESGLALDLVSNPSGAFLPPAQCQMEKRFRDELQRRWGVVFNHLYTFANVPLGRFRSWLERSGNLEPYLEKLAGAFNPATVDGLMCRSLLSVDWQGYLYDCDFNQACGLPMSGSRLHVSDLAGVPGEGVAVRTGDHCYACTAGSGFT